MMEDKALAPDMDEACTAEKMLDLCGFASISPSTEEAVAALRRASTTTYKEKHTDIYNERRVSQMSRWWMLEAPQTSFTDTLSSAVFQPPRRLASPIPLPVQCVVQDAAHCEDATYGLLRAGTCSYDVSRSHVRTTMDSRRTELIEAEWASGYASIH